jgi:hypothetical protein
MAAPGKCAFTAALCPATEQQAPALDEVARVRIAPSRDNRLRLDESGSGVHGQAIDHQFARLTIAWRIYQANQHNERVKHGRVPS